MLYVLSPIAILYLLYDENRFLISLSTESKSFATGSDKTISNGLKNLLDLILNVVLSVVGL